MGLDSLASKIGRFTYYTEISTGYAGFTDHHAMRCDLNNWLLKEPDDMQYWLAGFGAGFVETVARFCRDAGNTESTRHLILNSEDAKAIMAIDWLQRLQSSGVDNGPPSTANLLSALHGMCQTLEDEGPIRTEYWSKQKETASPTPESRAQRAEKVHQARQRGLDLGLRIR